MTIRSGACEIVMYERQRACFYFSLERGVIFSVGVMRLFYAIAVILLLMTVTLIVVAIIEPDSVFFALLVAAACFALFILYIYIIAGQKKLAKEAYLWLKDAVPLRATCVPVEYYYAPFSKPIPKVRITFTYGGRTLQKYSGKEGKSLSGFYKIFENCMNREIDIWYSPAYDQVLIKKSAVRRKPRSRSLR